MGIEPTLEAWEAAVLPLNYTRRGATMADLAKMKRCHKPRSLAFYQYFESFQIPSAHTHVAGPFGAHAHP